MTTANFVIEGEHVHVPAWVNDLEAFRRWTDDDAFPEFGHISFYRGQVWVDMSKEQLFTHNEVKSEINTVLRTLVNAQRLGRYFHDGVFLSNLEAEVSNQPDGLFVSTEARREGRVRVVEGRSEGHVELEGSPEMVLEVVSRSSVDKDTVILRDAYAKAGIREYWLVDARAEPLRFDILRPGRSGYVVVRKKGGWARSEVFAADFRLSAGSGEDGDPAYRLESRPV